MGVMWLFLLVHKLKKKLEVEGVAGRVPKRKSAGGVWLASWSCDKVLRALS